MTRTKVGQGQDLPDQVDAPTEVITSENVTQALEAFPRPFFEIENPFAS